MKTTRKMIALASAVTMDDTYVQNVSNYFNNPVPYYRAPDAVIDQCINKLDSDGILDYAATVGSGLPYNGAIGSYKKY